MRTLLLGVGLLVAVPSIARADVERPRSEPIPLIEERSVLVVAAVEALLLGDMLQTLEIRNHPDRYESNLIMGPHPSDSMVIGYFAVTGIAYAVAYEHLPPVLGLMLSIGVGALEMEMLRRNAVAGIGMRF